MSPVRILELVGRVMRTRKSRCHALRSVYRVAFSAIVLTLLLPGAASAAAGQSEKAPASATAGFGLVRPTYRVPPVYPSLAQLMNYHGVVRVCFTVTTQGAVTDAKLSGFSKLSTPAGSYAPASATVRQAQARKLLGDAALATIRQWQFVPEKLDGKVIATPGVCQDIRCSSWLTRCCRERSRTCKWQRRQVVPWPSSNFPSDT